MLCKTKLHKGTKRGKELEECTLQGFSGVLIMHHQFTLFGK